MDFDLKWLLEVDPLFIEMTSDGNFDCAVESGISNLVWLHISFACTGFRTRSEHPVGVLFFLKIAEISAI